MIIRLRKVGKKVPENIAQNADRSVKRQICSVRIAEVNYGKESMEYGK